MKLTPLELKKIASFGRDGDTMLAHINPEEARMLKAMGGSGTINPHTGLREYKKWWKVVASAVQSVGSSLSSVFKQTVNAVSSVFSNLGNAIQNIGSKISATAKAIIKNPLPMIETAALVFFGVPPAVASAAVTALNGGSIEDIAKGAAIGYIGGQVGGEAGQAFKGSELASTFSAETQATLVKVITSSSGKAAVAALSGGKIEDIVAQGLGGATGAYVNDILYKPVADGGYGYSKDSPVAKAIEKVSANAVAAKLSNQDVGDAIADSVAKSGVTSATSALVDEFKASQKSGQDADKVLAQQKLDYQKSVEATKPLEANLKQSYEQYSQTVAQANEAGSQVKSLQDQYDKLYSSINPDTVTQAQVDQLNSLATQAQTQASTADTLAKQAEALKGTYVANKSTYDTTVADVNKKYESIVGATKNLESTAGKTVDLTKQIGENVVKYNQNVVKAGEDIKVKTAEDVIAEQEKLLADERKAKIDAENAQAEAQAKRNAQGELEHQASLGNPEAVAQIKAQQDELKLKQEADKKLAENLNTAPATPTPPTSPLADASKPVLPANPITAPNTLVAEPAPTTSPLQSVDTTKPTDPLVNPSKVADSFGKVINSAVASTPLAKSPTSPLNTIAQKKLPPTKVDVSTLTPVNKPVNLAQAQPDSSQPVGKLTPVARPANLPPLKTASPLQTASAPVKEFAFGNV